MTMTYVPSTNDGAIPWLDVENGIAAWVRNATGFDADHVLWNRQSKSGDPAPTVRNDRYIALRFTNLRGIGGNDWERLEKLDEAVFGPHAYTYHLEGPRVATLQLRCFNADPLGAGAGAAILDRVRSWSRMPSTVKLIQRASFGVGPVTLEPRVVEVAREKSLLDPYAIMELDIHVASSVGEPGYIISFVHLEIKTTGGAELTPPTWVPSRPARATAAATLADATLEAAATAV